MLELNVMGRKIKVTGEGAEDCPFVLTGTGPSTPVAAEAEHAMLNHWMGKGNWALMKSSTRSTEDGRNLAVLTIRTFDENEELVQADIYFDISEAYNLGH